MLLGFLPGLLHRKTFWLFGLFLGTIVPAQSSSLSSLPCVLQASSWFPCRFSIEEADGVGRSSTSGLGVPCPARSLPALVLVLVRPHRWGREGWARVFKVQSPSGRRRCPFPSASGAGRRRASFPPCSEAGRWFSEANRNSFGRILKRSSSSSRAFISCSGRETTGSNWGSRLDSAASSVQESSSSWMSWAAGVVVAGSAVPARNPPTPNGPARNSPVPHLVPVLPARPLFPPPSDPNPGEEVLSLIYSHFPRP